MRCSYSPFLSKAVVVSNNVLPVLQAADNTKNSANALGELRPRRESANLQGSSVPRTIDSIEATYSTGCSGSKLWAACRILARAEFDVSRDSKTICMEGNDICL